MALILRYFTEFVYDVVIKNFMFAISSPDEFLVRIGQDVAVTDESMVAPYFSGHR